MVESALRFDHTDFVKSLKLDLGPILGDLGLWSLESLKNQAKERSDKDLAKKYTIAHELIEKYLENKFDTLGDEKKYNFINKLSPKKCPDQQVKRDSIKHLYSW